MCLTLIQIQTLSQLSKSPLSPHQLKNKICRSSRCGSAVHEPDEDPWGCGFNPWHCLVGQRSSVTISCRVGHRHSSDPALLCLGCRLVAVAVIRLLAWELPYATGVALKSKYICIYIYIYIFFFCSDCVCSEDFWPAPFWADFPCCLAYGHLRGISTLSFPPTPSPLSPLSNASFASVHTLALMKQVVQYLLEKGCKIDYLGDIECCFRHLWFMVWLGIKPQVWNNFPWESCRHCSIVSHSQSGS